MTLESVYKQIIKSPVHKLFLPLSVIYAGILNFKKYLSHFFQMRPNASVLSVGNLDFGGTGKTPTTLLILDHLKNKSVAILTRGYKSEIEHLGSTLVNQFFNNPHLSCKIGDEPALILNQFPKIPLYVGKKRKQGAQQADQKKIKLLILEDGGQFQKLKKDLEILLLDPEQPIKPLAPSGYRRDTLDLLKKADYLLFPYVTSEEQYKDAVKKIKKHTKAPCIGLKAELLVKGLSKKIALITAIARPDRLVKMLQRENFKIINSMIKDDHAFFSHEEIQNFLDINCHHQKIMFVCTQKDWVKLSEDHQKIFYSIELVLKPAFDVANWERFIGKIEKMS